MIKNLPAMRETWVQSLGQEDLLEKEVAAHSSILAWRIPWTEEPGGLQPMGLQESDTTEQLDRQTDIQRYRLQKCQHKNNLKFYFKMMMYGDWGCHCADKEMNEVFPMDR